MEPYRVDKFRSVVVLGVFCVQIDVSNSTDRKVCLSTKEEETGLRYLYLVVPVIYIVVLGVFCVQIIRRIERYAYRIKKRLGQDIYTLLCRVLNSPLELINIRRSKVFILP